MSAHLVVVGSINMDLVVRAPRLPRLGETILGSDFRTFPGGKGANQAVAAARLGGKVRMVGRVGGDGFGDALLDTLRQNQVEITYVYRDPQASTGVALITVEESGDNAIVVAPGANGRLSPQDIHQAEAAFQAAQAVVLQLECPLPTVEEAIKVARRYAVPVALNPAPAQALPDELLRQVDVLIPNQSELQILSGEVEIEEAIQALQKRGVKTLIVTLGEQGCLVVQGAERHTLAAHRVKAVDTTAAGDAFVGAFAVAWAEGKSLLEAARWGNAAGALAVTRAGAQPSLPTRQEVLDLL
ncbi:MAG: ribokinase [Anaerolineae bacterium]|jgi:ribokinase|nr:MAG: ribokinase [Anaerolineae bacterium]